MHQVQKLLSYAPVQLKAARVNFARAAFSLYASSHMHCKDAIFNIYCHWMHPQELSAP